MKNIFNKSAGRKHNTFTPAQCLSALYIADITPDKKTASNIITCFAGSKRMTLLSFDKKFFQIENNTTSVKSGTGKHSLLNRYFKGNINAVEDSLAEIVKASCLSEDCIMSFSDKILHYKNIIDCKSDPFGISRERIIISVSDCSKLRTVLTQRRKLHRIELSAVYAAYKIDKTSFTEEELSEMLAASFVRISEEYGDLLSKKLETSLWCKYVAMAFRLGLSRLPHELLNIDNFYKEAAGFLNQRINSNDRQLCESYSIQVADKILNDIDPNDVPSLLTLGNICVNNLDFDKAKSYFSSMSNLGFNGIMSLAACYDKELKHQLKCVYDGHKIYLLNKSIHEFYTHYSDVLRQKIDPNSKNRKDYITAISNYLTLISKFARNLNKSQKYAQCFKLLSDALEQFGDIACEGLYRIYTELGLLYQTPGKRDIKPNPYHSNNKSIDAFKFALSLIERIPDLSADVKSQKCVMIPLANTYYHNREYDNALDICRLVLSLDEKDQNAHKLISQINFKLSTFVA